MNIRLKIRSVSEFEILILKRSTFAHYILTQDTYIEWKDSKLRCMIKSVDQKDVYHLLLTQYGEGNTLSHVVWDEKHLMELLREVQCPELIFTLLSAQNSDGDTPFHKVHVDSFEKWLDMITHPLNLSRFYLCRIVEVTQSSNIISTIEADITSWTITHACTTAHHYSIV